MTIFDLTGRVAVADCFAIDGGYRAF